MSHSIDPQQLAEKFRLRDQQLDRIARQFSRLDEKLSALEARLPEFEEQPVTESLRTRKPR